VRKLLPTAVALAALRTGRHEVPSAALDRSVQVATAGINQRRPGRVESRATLSAELAEVSVPEPALDRQVPVGIGRNPNSVGV
jgi:hypothetical protein